MSDQVNIGEYSLEVSGDEVLVRDESGAIVDTVELDEVEGELTLPDGQTVDLASIFADAGLDAFQTAAGPANDNTGKVQGGSGTFIPFQGTPGAFDGLDSAGTLDETSLGYEALAEVGRAANDPEPQQQARSPFAWSRHETDAGRSESSTNPPSPQSQSANNPAPGSDEGEEDDIAPPSDLPSQNSGPSGPSNSGEPPASLSDEQQLHDNQEQPPHGDGDEQQPEDVNAAPTDIDLAGTSVVENISGAIIGALSVVDPDADESHSFAVSDDRFEVVSGQLKLKDGVALDFETTASVAVTVTVTDKAGNQLAEIFTIGVTDVNEAPTALHLSNLAVDENAAGGTVGLLTTDDPDAGETFAYQVSDSRFEVVGGQLQLKSGVSLDHETEQSVDLKITSTDSAGHSIERSFTIGVADANEQAIGPSNAGGADINGYELYTSQLGKGQTTLDAGDDLLHIDTKSFSPVRMGDGYDTVHLAQQDRSFDHHDAIKLENVEVIDATGYGANNVSLSIHDVLNMTDGDNRLTIIGDEGDTVTLTGHGSNNWTVMESNAEFTTYAYTDPSMQAVVEISNQMNAQVG